MATIRSPFYTAAIALFLGATAFLAEVFWTPITAAIVFLWPSMIIDPRESVDLDRVGHQAKLVGNGRLSLRKALAFIGRGLKHKRYSAGGFALNTELALA